MTVDVSSSEYLGLDVLELKTIGAMLLPFQDLFALEPMTIFLKVAAFVDHAALELMKIFDFLFPFGDHVEHEPRRMLEMLWPYNHLPKTVVWDLTFPYQHSHSHRFVLLRVLDLLHFHWILVESNT